MRAQGPAPADQAALVEKGRYLAVAGDCRACHTNPQGGKPFAGGYALASPLGSIVSSNITPSKRYGIGNYTEQQFVRALREGIRGDGAHLYPAMPYTSYTRLNDEDVRALYAYFMHGVAAVDEPAATTNLPFPFNLRIAMLGWNLLFLDDRRFVPDGGKSAQWNRGAYLVNALEHCDACHTPRNILMAEKSGRAFAGAPLGPWYAPNITSDPVSGIGGWTDRELVEYLKTGHVAGRDQAAGGMAEAVENSLQFLSDDDLQAVALYLKSVAPVRDARETKPAYAYGAPASFEAVLRGASGPNERNTVTSGEALYSGYCASCHQPTGAGSGNQAYPSLFHNGATGSPTAANLVAAVLFGVDRTSVNERQVLMPRFDELSYVNPLSDEQIAAVSNFVLGQFGNPSVQVTAAEVALARQGGPTSPLALAAPYLLPGAILFAAIVLGLIVLRYRRRRAARVLANEPR
ncbi:MAG TPA: cytochrome c [Xanthobacteraceae bacterium]|nr:cytochrome c [Xanthobacteraceae bacterium]